jgi:hypothetical protein
MSSIEVVIAASETTALMSRVNLNALVVSKLKAAGVPAVLGVNGYAEVTTGLLSKHAHPQFPLAVVYTWKPLTSVLKAQP